MPVEGPLPQTGDQQDIGADADRCFRARIPRDWRPHGVEGTDDYGIDYQIQTVPGQRATDIFRAQLKGTRSPDVSSDGKFISIQLKASTVRFYDRFVEPILLVVCDLSAYPDPVDCPLYYAWVRDELRRVSISTLDPAQKYVTLRVPTGNRLRSSTDLSTDIDAQNELARAGHALDVGVERSHPGMQVEERVGMIRQIAVGVSSRSAAFMDALAAAPAQHWVEPAAGTLAWRLREAERLLRLTSLDRAASELDAAETMLANGTALEVGDCRFLRGKWHTAMGADDAASESFRQAYDANPLGKYVAARVEAELRRQYAQDGPKSYPELLALLDGDDPFVLSSKSRVLAAEGRLDDAIDAADQIEGPERYAARAIAHTMFSKSEAARSDCAAGLAIPQIPENTRQLLLILLARAKFFIAQASAESLEGEFFPPSGAAGIDASLVRECWAAIEDALGALRESGWSPNVEHLADIWAATASILGKQAEALPKMAEVARLRPSLPNLQQALESLAAQRADFGLALEANDRLPESNTRSLRRAILLHEAQRHTDCVKWFEERFAELDRRHELFGPAATVAALSAHKLSKPDLVGAWSAELDSHPHLGEHAALLHYYVEIELNPMGAADALDSLTERYEAFGRPFAMAIALLQELNPTNEEQAPLCVELGARVRKSVEASPALAAHVGLALVTTEDWDGLLAWCEAFKARVDAGPRMLAFEALALDKLGRTHQARELLESMLAGGVLDSLALNTYTMIMVRCGYVQEALDAAEKILQSATTKRQQTDCLRLLFNLVQQSDPTSSRLLALAAQMGRLANQESEVEEGIFLTMFLTATLDERNAPVLADRNDFQRRVEAFFVRFPNSNILKRAQLREDASSAELMAQLKAMIGHSDEREAFQRRVENQLQQGLTAVPFCLRPKVALAHVRDAAHLWEIAKTSRVDDRKYHLTMIADTNWSPPRAAELRERTPMLDLTSLMVLLDLGLIDAAIDFFGQVAIAKSTLESLAGLARPFSGSPAAARAVALQNALKPRLGSIVQPSISGLPDSDDEDVDEEEDGGGGGDNRALGRELNEITKLCQDQRYRLYSDDLCVRILVAQGAEPDGICTLDVLAALEEVGALTAREAAQKVAALCRWHVGIVVRLAVFVALLPPALATVSSAKRGIELLDGDADFMAVANGVWDFRAPFEKVLSHAAAILRKLADESPLPNQALAAIFGQWFFKAALKDDAPGAPLGALAQLIARAALPPGMREAVAARLWTTYRQLVEQREGDFMDERKELVAIALLGAECARLRRTVGDAGEAARASLQSGLTEGTAEASAFMAGYSDELLRLSAQAKRGSR